MTHYSKNFKEVQRFRSSDPNCYTYVDGYGFTPPPPVVTERRILQWYSNGLGFSVLFYFLLVNIVPLLLFGLFSIFRPAIRMFGNQVVASPMVYHMVRAMSSSICKFLPFFLFLLFCRVPLRVAFPMRRFNTGICGAGICIALGVSVIGNFSSTLISGILSVFGLAPQLSGLSIPKGGPAILIFAVNIAVLQPVIEELVFRGVVFNSMRRFGDSFALLISSILFALFHGNLAQAPNAFVVGLVLGYFVLCTGSLWTGIIIHVVYNTMILFTNAVSIAIPESLQQLFLLFAFMVFLILGIVAVLILVKQYPNMFMFIRSTTFATERNKYRVFFTSMTMVVALVLLIVSLLQNLA